ncbi:FAD/NAD(P)-binding domain-containing protein [Melanomma pulvis-pyrius CBS 109.77]|uniref:FAD/NAD(P)-binding domain-containing protein n=1 Tax=Melanomma pulvis-pyrius CBS 109.77 TaxID=1314802 RepID=A0A6A6WRJ4_9PLEO|nr:FAD/NAD(P)-binding domain-containing protein [Melanomma pulvis-pyrius CBS 109.77]
MTFPWHFELCVIIVGSGLAGHTAARILREHRHVAIYERGSTAITTAGQGTISATTIALVRSPSTEYESTTRRGTHKKTFYDLRRRRPLSFDIVGEPAEMVSCNAVAGLDPEEGVATLSDGSTASVYVSVVADGVHSRLRDITAGDDSHNRSSLSNAADSSACMVTAYPLGQQTYFNLSCQDLKTLPTWTRGRAVLIGDDTHAMTPMQDQGANMSIEDAESLRLLAPGKRREDVPDILKLAESFRRPRVAQVLGETRKIHSTIEPTCPKTHHHWGFPCREAGRRGLKM